MDKLRLAGCIILKNNSILLLHRISKDWYELPGGKIDEKETAQEAAIREIKEELGCNVTIVRELGNFDFEQDGHTLNYTWFIGKLESGESPWNVEEETFDHFAFIPLAALSKHSLSTNMKNFVRLLEAKQIVL